MRSSPTDPTVPDVMGLIILIGMCQLVTFVLGLIVGALIW